MILTGKYVFSLARRMYTLSFIRDAASFYAGLATHALRLLCDASSMMGSIDAR